MTKEKKQQYREAQSLKKLLPKGKFKLDCGHHVTLNHHMGNDIVIQNGKEPRIICTLCAY